MIDILYVPRLYLIKPSITISNKNSIDEAHCDEGCLDVSIRHITVP